VPIKKALLKKEAAKKAVVKKPAAKKPASKKAMKKDDKLVCQQCGLVVTVDNVCGCIDVCDLICCGTEMKPKRK
jgi:membrane protease subunit (stomatin/prohibitin family)